MCVCRVGCGEVAFEPYMACLKLSDEVDTVSGRCSTCTPAVTQDLLEAWE